MKKATVYDVARVANVSVSTVSRYVNRTSYIAKEKVDAIEKAMAELSFVPKLHRSSAQTKRNMVLGIVTPTFDSPFVSEVLGGIHSQVMTLTYKLELEATNWNVEREAKIIKNLVEQKVDGIVMLVPSLPSDVIKSYVGNIPVVFVARQGEGLFPSLLVDNVLGGYIATNHLIQLGHKSILHVAGTDTSEDGRQRLEGYRKSLAGAGIEFDPELVVKGAYESQQAFDAVVHIVTKGKRFTAVFAGNDTSAYGVIQALYQLGIRVPEDVSVIGFDDLATSRFFIPRLTTIQQPLDALGRISIKTVLDLISHNRMDYSIPPVTLILRESTQPLVR